MILAIWYLVPLIWQQLIYARDNIPAVIGWINSTFCHGCRIPSMSLKWKLIPHRFLMWSWTMCKPIIVLTVFRPSCYALHNLELTFADWRYDCPDSNYCILFPAGLGSYAKSLRRLIPRRYEQSTLRIVGECHSVLGAFVKGQFLVMILLGIVYAIGLQLIGLEVGLIIGMVAGLASIIPYLGFAVGIIAAVIATFLQFGIDWWQLVLVGVVFMVGQAVEGYVLQPFLLGDKIGLSPVAVVLRYWRAHNWLASWEC